MLRAFSQRQTVNLRNVAPGIVRKRPQIAPSVYVLLGTTRTFDMRCLGGALARAVTMGSSKLSDRRLDSLGLDIRVQRNRRYV